MMRKRSTHALRRHGLRLSAVSILLLLGGLCLQSEAQIPLGLKPLPTLTHADQIRRLSPEQASQGYPVLVRGVITMDAPAPDFFVQDGTAGIYVEGNISPRYPHLFRQLVEIEGVTGPGKFAPVIR